MQEFFLEFFNLTDCDYEDCVHFSNFFLKESPMTFPNFKVLFLL